MSVSATPTNPYSDSPDLHSNLFLGSLQLVAWIFFHPAAWHNYAARLDPSLPPNFCLTDLQPAHWRSPLVRRLLIQRYVIWPLWTGVLIVGVLRTIGLSWQSIMLGLAFGLASDLASGALAGMAIGTMTGGIIVGLMSSLGEGLSIQMTGSLAFNTGVVGLPVGSSGLIVSAASGLAAGWAGSVVLNTVSSRSTYYSFARQTGSVVIGILVSGLVLLITSAIASGIASGVTGAANVDDPTYLLIRAVIFGVALGLVIGIAVSWRTHAWRWEALLYIIVFVVIGYLRNLASNSEPISLTIIILRELAAGLSVGMLFCCLFAIAYLIGDGIAGPWAGAVAAAVGSAGTYVAFAVIRDSRPLSFLILCVFCISVGLTVVWWRPIVSYPFLAAWNLVLYRADERRLRNGRPSLLRWNSAFWDEYQSLPLTGLDDHLMLLFEYQPGEGHLALDYLAVGRQRWAAQATQIELEARRLEHCRDIQAVSNAYRHLFAGELVGPTSALLRSLSRISQDVEAALRQESIYNQRLVFGAVEDRLDGLMRELTRSNEPYAARFYPIAVRWRQIVSDQTDHLAETAERKQEIDNPYVIGVPLTEQQEIFVGRADVSAYIERLVLNRDSSPVFLYGQRRMGKTSLLNNLGRLLPSNIAPFFVDLQGPVILSNTEADFFYAIARSMVMSAQQQRRLALPSLPSQDLTSNPFMRFDEWLDAVEGVMEAHGQNIALLSLDEFEMLDSALVKGHFSANIVLGMLRHLIQHRPRFKVLLAASHTLDELQRWSSYLINAQVVALDYLQTGEARQLIENPVKNFSLRYEPAAVQRVLTLTRQHPFLVQLMCAEMVTLKNEQPSNARRVARLEDVELAAHSALRRGSFFFADIERNQVDQRGLAVLRVLAGQGEAAIVNRDTLARLSALDAELELVMALLLQREIIEAQDDGYRFQVELIRRWFVDRKTGAA